MSARDTTEHLLDNVAGQASLYGIYRWLDKVYEARTFSYGSRLVTLIVSGREIDWLSPDDSLATVALTR